MVSVVFAGCKSEVQKTAVDIGGGVKKGEPPMCFQYQGEARPAGSKTNAWAHINNTCAYQVDCLIYDDVTEQQRRSVSAPHQTHSLLLQLATDAKRVDLELECTWKP